MFTVTYDIVTAESAVHGDAAERGFILPHGGRLELESAVEEAKRRYGEPAWRNHWPPEEVHMGLRDAILLVGCCESAGDWFTETSGRQDMHTGDYETRSLHCPDRISGESYTRIGRIFGAFR